MKGKKITILSTIFILMMSFMLLGKSGQTFANTMRKIYLPVIHSWRPIGDVGHLLITEVYYDPADSQNGVEWVEIFNPTGERIQLSNYKLGDEETLNGSEGMLFFPEGASIGISENRIIAANALKFEAVYGFPPDFEFADSGSPVPNMVKYTAWSGGNILLSNTGDELLLIDVYDNPVDAVAWGNSAWIFQPAVSNVEKGHSIERVPSYIDTDFASDWIDQPIPTPGTINLNPVPPTPTPAPTPTPILTGLKLSEVVYDSLGSEPGHEWIEIHNNSAGSVDLSQFKIGDEESPQGTEGMFQFPEGSIAPAGAVLVIANDGLLFEQAYGWNADFEFNSSHPDIPDMLKYYDWSSGNVVLSNLGDEVLMLDAFDQILDQVSWGSSIWAFDPSVEGVAAGHSIERNMMIEDSDTAVDWIDQPAPNPGVPFTPLLNP